IARGDIGPDVICVLHMEGQLVHVDLVAGEDDLLHRRLARRHDEGFLRIGLPGRNSSRIFASGTPNAAARRLREAPTAPTTSCCSGPAFLKRTPFLVFSIIGLISESATGSLSTSIS